MAQSYRLLLQELDDFDVFSPLTRAILLILILVPLVWFLYRQIHKDYEAFLALGSGGTPSTFSGYLRICVLRIAALSNPFVPPAPPPKSRQPAGYLETLPKRSGPRPKVAGIAPQRQLNQKATNEDYAALCSVISGLEAQHSKSLFTGRSCFEKHSIALFSKVLVDDRVTCNGEICHSHPSDGSLHLTLHHADVKVVLEAGWGQRHPLASESWWWWWHGRVVPTGFVMIYAPRDTVELESVSEIIKAAAWWVSDSDVNTMNADISSAMGGKNEWQGPARTPVHHWKRLFEPLGMIGSY